MALGHELGPQLAEVLDDAVVHDGDLGARMRVRVQLGRGAVGRPAGMADAGMAGQWVAVEHRAQIAELARRAAARDVPAHQGGDARRVVAAILETLECIEDDGRDVARARNADYSTHIRFPSAFYPLMPCPHCREIVAMPTSSSRPFRPFSGRGIFPPNREFPSAPRG